MAGAEVQGSFDVNISTWQASKWDSATPLSLPCRFIGLGPAILACVGSVDVPKPLAFRVFVQADPVTPRVSPISLTAPGELPRGHPSIPLGLT